MISKTNVNQYHHRISILFQSFLAGNLELDQLIMELSNIEDRHRQVTNTSGDMWFKFSQDDTLITTIEDLNRDLSSSSNREFALERLRESISLENELIIYYS